MNQIQKAALDTAFERMPHTAAQVAIWATTGAVFGALLGGKTGALVAGAIGLAVGVSVGFEMDTQSARRR